MCSTPDCGILCGQKQIRAGAIPAGLCGILGIPLFHSMNNTKTASRLPHAVGCHNRRIGKGPLTWKQAFSLQVAVNHNNCGSVIVQITDNYRHGLFFCQFTCSVPSVSGHQFITTLRVRAGNRWNQNTVLRLILSAVSIIASSSLTLNGCLLNGCSSDSGISTTFSL